MSESILDEQASCLENLLCLSVTSMLDLIWNSKCSGLTALSDGW